MESTPTIVFFHAHPDDEAIFTGGTMAMLAERGVRVSVLVATSGELGLAEADCSQLGPRRRAETIASCRSLGVDDVRFLDWPDSGMNGENPKGFCHVEPAEVVAAMGRSLESLGKIDALVIYDDHGIYGHPDHVQIYVAGRAAAAALDISTVYEATVDREYLHFVETHMVIEAGLGERPVGRGLAATDLGLPTLLIDKAVDVSGVLDQKRRAMAAHSSQLPADAPAFALGKLNFGAVYGFEWFTRSGPPTALDELPST